MKQFLKIPLYIVGLIVLGILSGHFTFKALSMSRSAVVPDLRGKTIVEANQVARSNNLYIRLEGEDYDSYLPQGYIIRQDVPAKIKIKEGREIRIVTSKGPRVQYVPDIVGQPLDRAELLLRDRGIKINRIVYARSDKTPKNVVMAQRPEPNEKGWDTFIVLVSSGGYDDKSSEPETNKESI
ncbi:MAG: PASTA domain-containing protein [Nitrospiraceae bacterium]|nr:PASTA domain-containing protein [Nitrospiraceae bacterium]